MPTESWREFAASEHSVWEVSDAGRIRRIRYLSGSSNGRGGGYLRADVSEATCEFGPTPLIHRLVVEKFLGPIPEGLEVDHLDGNTRNNAVDNLECVTHEENLRRARASGVYRYKSGVAHPQHKLSTKQRNQVIQLYKSGKFTRPEIADRFNVGLGLIYRLTGPGPKYWKPELVQLGLAESKQAAPASNEIGEVRIDV